MPKQAIGTPRLYRFARAFFLFCTVVLCTGLAVCSLAVTVYFPESYDEIPQYSSASFLPVIFCCGVFFALAAWIIPRCEQISSRAIMFFTCVIVFALGGFWAFSNHTMPTADRIFIYQNAKNLLLGDYSLLRPGAYFSQFPYQLATSIWAALIMRIFGEGHYFFAFQFFNAFFAAVLVYFLLRLTNLFTSDKKMLCMASFLCVAFYPIALLSTFIYGTLVSAAFSTGALVWAIRAVETSKYRFYAATAICITLAMLAKPNSAVFLVGLVILFLLSALRQRCIRPLFGLVVCVGLALGASELILYVMERLSGYDLHNGETFWAWIAMGLQTGPLAPGWYNEYNDMLYVLHQFDNSAITQEALGSIQESLIQFWNNPSYTVHFFGLKIISQWCEPTYATFWISKNALTEHLAPAWVQACYTGPVHDVLVFWADVLQTLLYAGAALALWKAHRTWSVEHLIPALVVFGGFVFHTFWEAKSLYIINYSVLLVPYAAKGFCDISCFLSKRLCKNHKLEANL
ncbi:hypothetical protein [uncultured Ruthenibacterium sp.]|mgnify:CR=1 FL=1|uniref:hypothetical protein n=1 Tax=uncultured Ruthenibacterium sp. TaxID=1905347 RepID=UPI00349E62FD